MSTRGRRPPRAIAISLVVGVLASCVHFNAVYNAERLYEETERDRRSLGAAAVADDYGEIIRKARRGLEADRGGPWSDDALFLIGRAHLRRLELTQAREALVEAERVADRPELRAAIGLYRGAVAVAAREPMHGLELLGALEGVGDDRFRAEGHLWRARAYLQLGRSDDGWRDLDRAGDAHADLRAPANLERLLWGFALGDTATAFVGLQGLIRDSGARALGDSVRSALAGLAEAWGTETAVSMMRGAEGASWSRSERDRLLLLRARLAHESGDTVLAFQDAGRVAAGIGEAAEAARLQMARWSLVTVTQLGDLASIRAMLLPIVEAPQARELLNAMLRVDFLVDAALVDEPVGFFGAAEIARNQLGSPELASSLYLAYADQDPDGPWAHKALLAAMETAGDRVRRSFVRGRLDALPETPYLRYARSGVAVPELAALEERLQSTLNDLYGRVDRELRARRLLILDPDDPGGEASGES